MFMEQISLYQTIDVFLEKSVCLIVEKCYLNNLRVIIVVPDTEMQELINKVLWTYSQKQFIPHGSKIDPMPSIQPIYITDTIENINNANTLILVNRVAPQSVLSEFDRVFVIYSANEEMVQKDIENFIKELKASPATIDFYKQTIEGKWQKKLG